VVAHAAADMYYESKKRDRNERNDAVLYDIDIKPRALWLALELRCDRIYHTLSRSIIENLLQRSKYMKLKNIENKDDVPAFGGLPNLALLSGDALHILPTHILPLSISAVYINHPEPPERTGGTEDSEGKHLLSQLFFNEIHRILKPNGVCTIVTDNLPYAKSILHSLVKVTQNYIKSLQSSSHSEIYYPFISIPIDSDNDNKLILEEEIKIYENGDIKNNVNTSIKNKDSEKDLYNNNEDDVIDDVSMNNMKTLNSNLEKCYFLQLWRGDSAAVNGNNEDNIHVSSYFDRMWKLGQKKRRWFITIRKL
jgi:tRNA G46 methylase TrmB